MKAALVPALLGLTLVSAAACASKPEMEPRAKAPPEAQADTAKAPDKAEPASRIVSLPFRVDITFSEKAEALMQSAGGPMGVTADYYGAPKDPSADGLDPELGVWLGGEMETLPSSRRSVTLKGQFDAARVAREVVGDPRMRVTAFTMHMPAAVGRIKCSDYDEALPIVVETGAVVHCKLATE